MPAVDKSLIKNLIRSEILNLQAYHVQPSSGLVKLDMMENPYNWTDDLCAQWLDRLKQVNVNRYPDASAQAVKRRLLSQTSLPDSCDVIFGNGSDELIQIIIQALSVKAGPVLSVSPTFVMYQNLAGITGKEYVGVPLKGDFSLDIESMSEAIHLHQPACIFLACPNNPTGNLFTSSELESILDQAPGLVVIDEAYLPFAGVTFIDKLANYKNLLVMRTFSKAGLAGLRFGMLFGNKTWLHQFNKIRLPLNINCLTQVSVEFALENTDFFEINAQKIVEERARVAYLLDQFPGLDVFPSDANFILFRSNQIPAQQVFEQLLERHILIKCLHKPNTLLDQCLRVTIGTGEENDLFLDSMKAIFMEQI